MPRIQSAVASAFFAALALLGTSDNAAAQVGCQPTIMQPCTNVPARPGNPVTDQKRSTQADQDSDAPKDHSPHIKLDNDTDFRFGSGGIGLGRKF